ncbi:MAG: ATP-binding cassette domain-containing protein [Ardenticatenaceae bacterium]|nr:ATP-binding cassette domain-containing protein [Ardenticatenaceae bacterium]
MYAISVDNLSKSFFVPIREAGLRASFRSLFKREHREVLAVQNVSFSLEPGEMVGFLGPNGAGKTTTLKMLSGLLHPTAGEVEVMGFTPTGRDKEYLRQMTLIMGNRHQLIWDIPALDSFELNRAIYRIPHDEYLQTRDEFIDLLDLQEIVTKPVRNLSLGERMKVEIVAALLHRPKILFLDEPTIGLDVAMQRRIREFVKTYNERYQATVMLTSHYMADIEALCRRVIVIHNGQILFDGALADLVKRYSANRRLVVTGPAVAADFSRYGVVVESGSGRVVLNVPRADAANVTSRMLHDMPEIDLLIEDPAIEDVIEDLFAGAGMGASDERDPLAR